MDGWVKVHRKILESPVFENPNLFAVWIYCLMRATYKSRKVLSKKKEMTLLPGQFLTGRAAGARDCKMAPSTFWDAIQTLKSLEMADIRSDSLGSLITIVNWERYQGSDDEPDSDFDSQPTALRQRSDTNKKDKKEKNVIKGRKTDLVERPKDSVGEEYKSRWNRFVEICNARFHSNLRPVIEIGPTRLRQMRPVVSRESFNFNSIAKEIMRSKWLLGLKDGSSGIEFDWIFCDPNNYVKILEGKYSDSKKVGRRGRTPTSILAGISTPGAVPDIKKIYRDIKNL